MAGRKVLKCIVGFDDSAKGNSDDDDDDDDDIDMEVEVEEDFEFGVVEPIGP
ncbi:hypothetical protein Vi05172_g1977 [Venturia inaequalis]|nr:hypothetical protein Vi05172_g1977 [Venturia inaequalis]